MLNKPDLNDELIALANKYDLGQLYILKLYIEEYIRRKTTDIFKEWGIQ